MQSDMSFRRESRSGVAPTSGEPTPRSVSPTQEEVKSFESAAKEMRGSRVSFSTEIDAKELLKATPSAQSHIQHHLGSRSASLASSASGVLRSLSSSLFGIPFGFFNSRAEVRTWGEEQLADPSIQPHRRPPTTTPFHQTLPGYSKRACEPLSRELMGSPVGPFVSLAPPGGFVYNPHHPNMEIPKVDIQYPKPACSIPPPSYDYKSLSTFKMNNLPYVNAFMSPTNPSPMYVPGNYMVAYPYGVPAVEENEAVSVISMPKKRACSFLC